MLQLQQQQQEQQQQIPFQQKQYTTSSLRQPKETKNKQRKNEGKCEKH